MKLTHLHATVITTKWRTSLACRLASGLLTLATMREYSELLPSHYFSDTRLSLAAYLQQSRLAIY